MKINAIPVPERPARRSNDSNGVAGRLAHRRDLERYGMLVNRGADHSSETIALPNAWVLVERGTKATGAQLPTDLTHTVADLTLPEHLRARHVIIMGKSGSGKTTSLILPWLVQSIKRNDGLIVCLSAKGDLTRPVREACRRAGAKLFYISPTEPDVTLKWNPIAELRDAGDAEALATMLADVVRQGENETEYFRAEAIALLTPIINACRRGSSRCGLGEISDGCRTALELQKLAKDLSLNDVLEFASAAAGSSNHRTTLSTMLGYTRGFAAKDVRRCVSAADIRLSELGDSPAVLLVHIPEHESERLMPFTTILIASLINSLYRKASSSPSGRLPVECTLVLDEFASALGRLDLASRINTLRSRNIRVVAAVQTIGQIVERYRGMHHTLLAGFGTRIAVPPLTVDDAEILSRESGLMVQVTASQMGGERIIREEERPLLSPGDLMTAPTHPERGQPTVWFTPGTPPFYAYLKPLYLWPEWKEFMRAIYGDGTVDEPDP